MSVKVQKTAKENADALIKSFNAVLKRKGLSDQLFIAEVHFVANPPAALNCHFETTCRREPIPHTDQFRTVCRRERVCD